MSQNELILSQKKHLNIKAFNQTNVFLYLHSKSVILKRNNNSDSQIIILFDNKKITSMGLNVLRLLFISNLIPKSTT